MLVTTLPATFVALGLITGLSIDTYRTWRLTGMVVECKPQFTVDLSEPHLLFHSGTRVQAKQQAIVAWVQGVIKTYGTPYANFWDAKKSLTAVKQCQRGSKGDTSYCGHASGQPCGRITITTAPPELVVREPKESQGSEN
jgi:hypothetical protein